MASDRRTLILYWILTGLTGVGMLAGGFANVMHAAPQVEIVVTGLGFPE